MKVLLVANRGFALASSRKRLISSLVSQGHTVIIATARDSFSETLASDGVILEEIQIDRGGFSIGNDWRLFLRLISVYRKHRPDIIHHFHGKPVILGTLAARIALRNRVSVVNSITGLGHAFITGGLVRVIAGSGYRIMKHLADRVIFQNHDDMALFLQNGWADPQSSRVILSSGVDTERYKPGSVRDGDSPGRVLFVGRLLWQKGIGEYLKAIALLKPDFPEVSFEIAGEFDLIHPDAVSKEVIAEMEEAGTGRYLGCVGNLEEVYPKVDLVVLPSYREGVPRVVLEAAACGVATVGANVPGTREAIKHEETGLLVSVKDHEALAQAIEILLCDRKRLSEMGIRARNMIEQDFDIRDITEQQLDVYRELGLQSG